MVILFTDHQQITSNFPKFVRKVKKKNNLFAVLVFCGWIIFFVLEQHWKITNYLHLLFSEIFTTLLCLSAR